ncbi:hypothetical protein FM076_21375 [Streptomyces albus subsp. chlorinus]|nr:hypothetical protein [Streptomyces albus subsp. chlorinus]
MKKISSEILDLVALKGAVSKPGPGVVPCEGKNADKYYRMLHTWSVTPSGSDAVKLDEAVRELKESLPRRGWDIKRYGPDGSANKNVNLVADHDEKKFSVDITSSPKENPPMLIVSVISGCYKVPPGETVEHY